jgi:hypothetical protein
MTFKVAFWKHYDINNNGCKLSDQRIRIAVLMELGANVSGLYTKVYFMFPAEILHITSKKFIV